MVQQGVGQFCFNFIPGLPVIVESKNVQVSSDAGILPIKQFDDQIGLTERFIACLNDPRDPDLTRHHLDEMVRQRIFGILAGYEDCNDHDTLRGDPVFKMVSGRMPNDDDLAPPSPDSRTPSTSLLCGGFTISFSTTSSARSMHRPAESLSNSMPRTIRVTANSN